MRVLCFWNMYVFVPDRAVFISDLMFGQLDDLDEGTPLLPPGDAKLRAHCRLWGDHVRSPSSCGVFVPDFTILT